MQFASFYTSSKSEELIRKLDAEILALMEKRTKLQKPPRVRTAKLNTRGTPRQLGASGPGDRAVGVRWAGDHAVRRRYADGVPCCP